MWRSHAPFHLTRRGWGEFPVRVQLHFRDGVTKSVDIIHKLTVRYTRCYIIHKLTVHYTRCYKECWHHTQVDGMLHTVLHNTQVDGTLQAVLQRVLTSYTSWRYVTRGVTKSVDIIHKLTLHCTHCVTKSVDIIHKLTVCYTRCYKECWHHTQVDGTLHTVLQRVLTSYTSWRYVARGVTKSVDIVHKLTVCCTRCYKECWHHTQVDGTLHAVLQGVLTSYTSWRYVTPVSYTHLTLPTIYSV